MTTENDAVNNVTKINGLTVFFFLFLFLLSPFYLLKIIIILCCFRSIAINAKHSDREAYRKKAEATFRNSISTELIQKPSKALSTGAGTTRNCLDVTCFLLLLPLNPFVTHCPMSLFLVYSLQLVSAHIPYSTFAKRRFRVAIHRNEYPQRRESFEVALE